MRCEQCHETISAGEEMELHGRVLCEDCYMDALSPARACDPWAVHSAKSFLKEDPSPLQLNKVQERILQALRETGGLEPKELSERLQMKPSDLEREVVALRHMEKVRGELREGTKVIRLW